MDIGRYQVEKELGRGGFGCVYRAYDPGMQRWVAIKLLTVHTDPSALRLFRNEVVATGNLKHKNIVTVHDFGVHDRQPYLVMDLLQGHSLKELIDGKAPLTLLEKLTILSEIADGLHCAHQGGITHRDIKPANVMRVADGSIRVLDFGIARIADQTSTVGGLIGTPSYMAPDLFRGDRASALTDIWSYGVTAYELLTGVRPFQGENHFAIQYRILNAEPAPLTGVPAALQRIVSRTLEKEPSRRYQSLDNLLVDLAPLIRKVRTERAEAMVAEAERLFAAGRLSDAQALAREVLAFDPGNPAAYWLPRRMEGRDALRRRDFAAAIAAFRESDSPELAQALQAQQASASCESLLAEAEASQDARAALDLLERAARADANHPAIAAARERVSKKQRAAPNVIVRPEPGTVRINPKDGLPYVWIPPGRFMMGCSPGDGECYDDEKPQHEEIIAKGFWIGQTPVTQEAYQRVMGTNPSRFQGPKRPVERITWHDAKAYAERVGMRLPTEAEWEYAARATDTRARYGPLDDIAWYSGNSGGQTHDVGGKQPNKWGLYDTLGNLFEWTDTLYPGSQLNRVARGGSWSIVRDARVSNRYDIVASFRLNIVGVRCAGDFP